MTLYFESYLVIPPPLGDLMTASFRNLRTRKVLYPVLIPVWSHQNTFGPDAMKRLKVLQKESQKSPR